MRLNRKIKTLNIFGVMFNYSIYSVTFIVFSFPNLDDGIYFFSCCEKCASDETMNDPSLGSTVSAFSVMNYIVYVLCSFLYSQFCLKKKGSKC
jgi:hypothetical protein